MGRKPDPKGKDRPRTIVLSGDVAEIAQRLADKNQLSKVLSDLLRSSYGFGDALQEKQRALDHLIDERKQMQQQEEALITEIEAIENLASIKAPELETRIAILNDRLRRAEEKVRMGINTQTYVRQAQNLERMIGEVKKEMEDFQ